MQVVVEPWSDREQETHQIQTFLISTKPNEAGWCVPKHENIQDWVGRDFVIIPEKIFDPNEKQPGHITGGTYEETMAEIAKHSHGKITKVTDPIPYEDGTDDVYYNATVKLNDSLSASALIENGSKTWTKFAVSPSIWRMEGPKENITKYKPMGLFLVIKGAYGNKAVIEKMCSGSELKCGTALSAAILNLNHDTSDEYLGEVLNSYIKLNDDNKHNMSQVQELKKEITELPNPITEQPKLKVDTVTQPTKEEVKIEQPKDNLITLSHEEFESYKKEREEHKQLVLENKTNKLNSLFEVVEDQEQRSKLVEKYIDKDVNLIIQYHKDIVPYVEKFAKGKEVKVEEKDKSQHASVLKEEPKKETDQSEHASIVPNKVNEVLVISKMFAGEVL